MNLLQINSGAFRFKCPSFLTRLWRHKPEKTSTVPMAAELATAQSADTPITASSPEPLTPLTWLEGIPHDMSLVVYIDQASVQIMEIVAVSRKLATNLFGIPQYTGKHAVWQTIGKFNLRKRDFVPATAFQQQEDALNELESLLAARWHASTELSHLDQSIRAVIESTSQPSPCAESGDSSSATAPIDATLRELLQSRQVVSEEAARIDATVIGAFQRIGVAIPDDTPGPKN